MHVIGIGTDLVAVARFTRLLDRGGRDFLSRWFTPSEIAYCLAKERPAQHAAARFAAKEAVLKALRLSGDGPLAWREIEVVRDRSGRPGVELHGSIRSAATSSGADGLEISLSHDAEYATATAIAFGWEATARPHAADLAE